MIVVLSAGGIIITANFLSTDLHEEAHKIINSYYGVDSHIEVNYFGVSYTIPDENFATPEDRKFAYLGHSMNEAVGYQIKPLFNGVMLLLLLLCSIGLLCLFELISLNNLATPDNTKEEYYIKKVNKNEENMRRL